MDTEPKFKHGDLVYRNQDLLSAKEGDEIPGYFVHDPYVPTDMKRVVTGEPVNFYVEIHPVDPLKKGGLYHQENLGDVDYNAISDEDSPASWATVNKELAADSKSRLANYEEDPAQSFHDQMNNENALDALDRLTVKPKEADKE